MKIYVGRLLLASALLTLAPAVQARILSGALTGGSAFVHGGSFLKLDPSVQPFSVGFDNFNTNNLYGFDELQNFVLTAALATNVGQTIIPAGTRISSQIVFFDPLGTQTTAKGTVQFSSDILAVITLRPALIASQYLRNPQVTYSLPPSVGLESGIDFIQIGNPTKSDLKVITLNADSPGDLMRVITVGTARVPEPASWALMLAGFILAGGLIRRNRMRNAVALRQSLERKCAC